VDLLRVFLYDPVSVEQLGSSPHTDWGSWTVVWQDDVGGLQTYCQAHEKWVNVAASPLETSRATFVVHVGDVTSLAMGHASSQSTTIVWPSPKHRVISPSESIPRASLVYFAYPPPGISLKDMEQALGSERWGDVPAAIPYNKYFVLQNQSTGDKQAQSPEETYRDIRSRPLDSVFAEKWQQVQRSTTNK
jgi:isopenicillin N synthase-like dioxygenase